MEEGKHFSAVTVTNGNISTPFKIQRGCRQGDPISGYLFILAIEILALLLKNSKIRPYTTKHGIRHLFDIYADDPQSTWTGTSPIVGKTKKMSVKP